MRRRAEKTTIPEPFVSMREVAQQWHARLNSSTGRMSDVVDNGRRDPGLQTSAQGD